MTKDEHDPTGWPLINFGTKLGVSIAQMGIAQGHAAILEVLLDRIESLEQDVANLKLEVFEGG